MIRITFAAIVFGLAAGAAHADGKDVFGIWLTQSQTAKLEITDCGDGTPCGRVVWIDPASLPEGLTAETSLDVNNPDPAMQDRPVLGLMMLSGFEARRRDWRGGEIYDPEEGRTYGSRLKRLDDGTLEVKGCVGPFCQTQVWQPATLEEG
ncbi:MAG: DUF2147 domain-containing protein [Pseudomonadota bacterium]